MELDTKFFIYAIVVLIVGYLFISPGSKSDDDQSIQTRPQPAPIPPAQNNPPIAPPTQNNVQQINTTTGFRYLDAFINFVKVHWAITALFGLMAIWLLSWIFTCAASSIATNISSTVQTTGYSVADSWSENKKAHDQKTGNGNYIPTRISADIDITAEKKMLWCKPGFKTGPIQLESSGLETFFFDVDEIRLNPVGTKTILVMDKLKPTCKFSKGDYYIFIPKNILADTLETDAGIYIEIKKAIIK
jgi:hypothetical protein